MTDEQFKQLMDKLEELKRSMPAPNYIGHPGTSPYLPAYPKPLTQPGQYWDGYPDHWHTQTRD